MISQRKHDKKRNDEPAIVKPDQNAADPSEFDL